MRMARSSHNPASGRNLAPVIWRRATVSLLVALALALPAAALARSAVTGAAKTPIVRAALGATVPRQCADVLHHTRGRWRVVTDGSAFTCPIRHVPGAIARDLRISCH
jgi:hypothetical protein